MKGRQDKNSKRKILKMIVIVHIYTRWREKKQRKYTKIKIYRYNFVIFPYTEFDNWNYHNLWNSESRSNTIKTV